jgi:hypothetical protein
MATVPWRSFGRAEPERQYVALLSYLPLKRGLRIPWFLLHTVRIMGQLRRSRGTGRVFATCEAGGEAFLDALGMGRRSSVARLRPRGASCANNGGAGATYGRDQICSLDAKRFGITVELGGRAQALERAQHPPSDPCVELRVLETRNLAKRLDQGSNGNQR